MALSEVAFLQKLAALAKRASSAGERVFQVHCRINQAFSKRLDCRSAAWIQK